MSAPSALASVFRLLLLGLLLGGFALKPAVALAEEIHELTAHAAVAGDGHELGGDRAAASDDTRGDTPDHDDDHWHLSHCCGNQAAVLPRLELALPLPVAVSPVPPSSVAFVPSPRTAPFRPPISA